MQSEKYIFQIPWQFGWWNMDAEYGGGASGRGNKVSVIDSVLQVLIWCSGGRGPGRRVTIPSCSTCWGWASTCTTRPSSSRPWSATSPLTVSTARCCTCRTRRATACWPTWSRARCPSTGSAGSMRWFQISRFHFSTRLQLYIHIIDVEERVWDVWRGVPDVHGHGGYLQSGADQPVAELA